MLQLDALLDRKPRQLSGGQRQRVAIGRAIVREPTRLPVRRAAVQSRRRAARRDARRDRARCTSELGATMIYVTHDQVEAMTLADRIVVLNAGRIEQVGAPLELYHTPANRFVAGFIGSPQMNFLPPSSLSGPARGRGSASGRSTSSATDRHHRRGDAGRGAGQRDGGSCRRTGESRVIAVLQGQQPLRNGDNRHARLRPGEPSRF